MSLTLALIGYSIGSEPEIEPTENSDISPAVRSNRLMLGISNGQILKIAAETLGVTVDEVQKNNKEVPEIDAFYFWNPVRGGGAVIIANNGEKLAAGSSVNFDIHVKAFADGRRN